MPRSPFYARRSEQVGRLWGSRLSLGLICRCGCPGPTQLRVERASCGQRRPLARATQRSGFVIDSGVEASSEVF